MRTVPLILPKGIKETVLITTATTSDYDRLATCTYKA